MCTNKYSNKKRYDKVIAKTKWCSFLCLTVYILNISASENVDNRNIINVILKIIFQKLHFFARSLYVVVRPSVCL